MTEGDIKERLSMLTWMIDRYDVLRVAISRRAAIVLSADAILVTATIFLFGQYHSSYLDGSHIMVNSEKNISVAFIAFSVATIACLCLSILSATSSIVNVWAKSSDMPGGATPQIYFFHARDTYEDFKNFESFQKTIQQSSDKDFLNHAEAELWRVIVATYVRHNELKRAIVYLYWAIFPFLASLVIFSIMLMFPLIS